MGETFRPIRTIGWMEFRMRMRRNTTVAMLLIVAAIVYLIIPDLSTGRSLLHIGRGRAFYNSAAVALGSAIFCSALISLLGFYVCSSSVRRDLLSRTGFIISSTPVLNRDYILGKFSGNFFYLVVIVLTSLASAMVMFLIRGETTLEPSVFLVTYAWLVIPSAVFTSAAAICFEAVPFLSGRVGDVLYFLFWGVVISIPAMSLPTRTGFEWTDCLDILGLGPLVSHLQAQYKTTSISIGSSEFDPRVPPVVFNGIRWIFVDAAARICTLVLPALLLLAATFGFHRFNPTRVASSLRSSKSGIWSRLNALLKPATRISGTLMGRGNSFPAVILSDAALTVTLSPLFGIAAIVVIVLSLTLATQEVQSTILPLIVVILVMMLADISARDEASGMQELLSTAPRIRRNYTFWKFGSALLLTLCLIAGPIFRLFTEPHIAISMITGGILLAGSAVSFGILTRSGKLFVAVFLLLLYIGLNAREVALFDFIGISGRANPSIQSGYTALSALLLFAAGLKQRRKASS